MAEGGESNGAKGVNAKRRVGRSPAYPFISVRRAIEQARALHAQEGDYAAPLAPTLRAWGYAEKSSGGRQTLATMKYYGLIEIAGEGDDRKVKVSDVARRIILDRREDDTERRDLIRKVALAPAAHKALFDQYPRGLASDGTVEHYLTFDAGFNTDAARELLAEYKETASFAGLYQSDKPVDKSLGEEEGGEGRVDPPAVKVGDRIQCTVGGVDQFPNGAIVLGFTEDGKWAFTDQSRSGVPLKDATIMESATLEKPGETPPDIPAHLLAKREEPLKAGTRKAVFPLDAGDVSLIFPEAITAEGLEELGAYLDIFLKKEARKKA